jgi:hypothetical protein
MPSVEHRPEGSASADDAEPRVFAAPVFGAQRAIWIVFAYLGSALCVAAALGTAFQLVEFVRYHKLQHVTTGTAVALGSVATLIAGAIAYRMARRSFSVDAGTEFKSTLGLLGAPRRELSLLQR